MSRADGPPVSMLAPREWRFVRAGALVSALALVSVYGVLPFARHWRAREAQLEAERGHLARLESLVEHRAAIDSAAASREALLAASPRRVLRARSEALASASLQSLLQDMADASNLTVTRLDVASPATTSTGGTEPDAASPSTGADSGTSVTRGGPQLPVTLSANGDIFGLAAFLGNLRTGSRVIVVDRLSVQVNSALRGAPDVLQMTVSLKAPVIVE